MTALPLGGDICLNMLKKFLSTLVSCRFLLILLFARFKRFDKPFCFYSEISVNDVANLLSRLTGVTPLCFVVVGNLQAVGQQHLVLLRSLSACRLPAAATRHRHANSYPVNRHTFYRCR